MWTVDQELAMVLCCRVGVGNWTQALWQSSGASREEGFKAGLLSCAQVPQAHSGDVGRVGFFPSWKTGQNRMAVKWWWTLWAPDYSQCALSGQVRAIKCLSGMALQQRRVCFLLSFPFLFLFASLILPPPLLWVCFRFHTCVWGSRDNEICTISESVSSVPLRKSEFLFGFWRGSLEAFLGKRRGIFQRKTSSTWEVAAFY